MTPLFTARRRAEAFHDLVEQSSTGTRGSRFDDQLGLVEQLRGLPTPEPRPEFTADLRERLLAAADTELVPTEETQRLTLPSRSGARDRRLAVAVGGLAVVGATTSLAVAAQSALPGEMLYPVKRLTEEAQTFLHAGDEAKGVSLLDHATDRLVEATTLSRSGDLGEGDHVAQALVDFADQATDASDLLLADYAETGDEAAIEDLRDFTGSSLQTLTELEAVLPEEARDELLYAVQVLDEIDRAAERACPACAGGIDQIPSVLLSAGTLDESGLVVVPDSTLPGTSFSEETTGSGKTSKGGGGAEQGGEDPLPEVEVPASAVGGSDSDSADDDQGPVGTLTDTLTGQLDGDSSGEGGGGLTGVPEVDDTVDGVVEDLDDALPDLP